MKFHFINSILSAMLEQGPHKENKKLIPDKTLPTDIGNISRFDHVIRNGVDRTIYSFSKTDYELGTVIKNIEEAEIQAKNPVFLKTLEAGQTSEGFTAEMGGIYREALKEKAKMKVFRIVPLLPLIIQEAMRQAFQEAEKALQKPD